jgi:hypothetical protein
MPRTTVCAAALLAGALSLQPATLRAAAGPSPSAWRSGAGPVALGAPLAPGQVIRSAASYQDVILKGTFRCGPDCDFGMLIDAKPSGTGWEGVYLRIASAGSGLFTASVDAAGAVGNLQPIAPFSGVGRVSGQKDLPRPSAGAAAPPARAPAADRDNTVEIYLGGDILQTRLNGQSVISTALPLGTVSRFGPMVIVPRAGQPTFSSLTVEDALIRPSVKQATSPDFDRNPLRHIFYGECSSVADFNRDGKLDVSSGPFWYEGGDMRRGHEIYLVKVFSWIDASSCYNSFVHDFNGDGFPDIIQNGGIGSPVMLYLNPGADSRRWDEFTVVPVNDSESTLAADLDGDGVPEFIHTNNGRIRYAKGDKGDFRKPWSVADVSDEAWGRAGPHAIGAADINGDGKVDVLAGDGWFEQSKAGLSGGFTYRRAPFSPTTGPTDKGSGVQMVAYDINGDGLLDVASSWGPHRWGLGWAEQKRDAAGQISFVAHTIMDPGGRELPGGPPVFSELHAIEMGDVDGDGVKDLVTGKRLWVIRDAFSDPDPFGASVLYWFKLVRDGRGGARFEPHLIDNDSGVGTQIQVTDLNGDGKAEIVTANRIGAFVFSPKASLGR